MLRLITALAFLLGAIAAAQAVDVPAGPDGGRHIVAHHETGHHDAQHHGGTCPGEQNGAYHGCGAGMLALNAEPVRFAIGRATSAGFPRMTTWRAQFIERDPPVPRFAA